MRPEWPRQRLGQWQAVRCLEDLGWWMVWLLPWAVLGAAAWTLWR